MLPVSNLNELDDRILNDFFAKYNVESARFDYKRELGLLESDGVKKELLKDVTAFANSQGGDILVGIDQEQGLLGIEETAIDKRLLQIESIIRENTDPPIPGLQMRFVPIHDDKFILVIRIPKSYIRPHRISKEGRDFWARGEAGNFAIKMPQLRNLFFTGREVKVEIERFISERTTAILSNNSFVNLNVSDGVFIFHVIPISGFEEPIVLDYKRMKEFKDLLVPIGHRHGYLDLATNFEGILRYSGDGNTIETYAQLFYSGVIESVNTWVLSVPSQWGPYIHSDSLSIGLFSGLTSLLSNLQKLNVSYPILLHLGLHGVKDRILMRGYEDFHMAMNQKPLRDSVLRFPSIVLNNPSQATTDNYFVKELQIWIDLLWRASGQERCPSYTERGFKEFSARERIWPFLSSNESSPFKKDVAK